MQRMKRVVWYFVFLWFCAASYGQGINLDSIFETKLGGKLFQMRAGLVGSQFYNDDWVNSDLKLITGETVHNKKLKYDALLDEVIWLQEDSFREVELEKHFIREFCFKNYQNRQVCFRRIRAKLPQMIDSADIFVEVLLEKSSSLFVFRKVKVEGSVNRLIGGVLCSFEKLVPDPVYLISLPGGNSVFCKRIRRHLLLKALPDAYKTKVREIIQRNHLTIRTEEDLARLVGLIN